MLLILIALFILVSHTVDDPDSMKKKKSPFFHNLQEKDVRTLVCTFHTSTDMPLYLRKHGRWWSFLVETAAHFHSWKIRSTTVNTNYYTFALK